MVQLLFLIQIKGTCICRAISILSNAGGIVVLENALSRPTPQLFSTSHNPLPQLNHKIHKHRP